MVLRAVADERRFDFDGCFNFRDLGGYASADGRPLRWRRLFRSDGVHRMGADDRARLARLGLVTVLDLRTMAERATEGSFDEPGVTCHRLSMADLVPSTELQSDVEEAAMVADQYHEMLARGTYAMREALAILTDPASYPAVVCCSAGHHRTGIVAAVLLSLAGVPEHEIVADYVASRETMARRLRSPAPAAVELEGDAAAMLGVLSGTIVRFLARLRDEYGSAAGYAKAIDMAEAVPYVRAALLSPR